MPARSTHCCGDFFGDASIEDAGERLQPFCDWLDTLVGTQITQKTKVTFVIYQEEECPESKKRHIQWYIQFASQVEWKKQKEWLTAAGFMTAHFEACRGSSDSNVDYCSKEESRVPEGRAGKHGELRHVAGAKGQGSREDIKKLKVAIDGGATWRGLLDDHFGTCARHPQFIRDYIELKRGDELREKLKQRLTGVTLRGWQQHLLEIVKREPIRTVMWYWETVGYAGKSFMAEYLDVMHGALVLQSMKRADMLHLISKHVVEGLKTVIFDMSRTSEEGAVNVVYDVIELLNNGQFSSGKYESTSLRFARPHVIVFANFAPDQSKLSEDRWRIKNILDDFEGAKEEVEVAKAAARASEAEQDAQAGNDAPGAAGADAA